MKSPKPLSKLPTYSLKNHPFVVPVVTFLCLFIVSLISFVFMGGSTLKANDSHIVHVHVDGKEQILPSRAEKVSDLLQQTKIEIGEHDVVEPALDAQVTEDNFSVNVYRAHPVTIIEDKADGKKTSITTYTAQDSPNEIAKQAGITLLPEDKATVTRSDNVLQEGIINQKVVIERATPIKLNLYGVTYDVRTHAQTVEDLLKERGIAYDSASVSPALTTPLTPGSAVFVTNVGKKITTTEEAIPNVENSVTDPNLPVGQTAVQIEGAPGLKVVIYEVAADGTQKALQEVIVREPVARVIARGTKVVNTRIAGDKSSILAAAGVPDSQHFAADFVIARESGWNLAAQNAGGCLGLGQACPGGKLINACPNWQSDATCQVRFFSGYANGRYGSWQGAYNFWLINHWW
ncbi:MAG: ubiquitin-like domain-containing protein [Candidatus Saccharimonadales bacterium]